VGHHHLRYPHVPHRRLHELRGKPADCP
jgi:hypothetical protein